MSAASDLRHLLQGQDFRTLTSTRLLSQLGSGMFEVGLASLFFFDASKPATPESVALGFIVLLAPFTIVGPFVGPLIDRWKRQRILMWSTTIRLGLAVILGCLMVIESPTWITYIVALLSLSINRFLLAAHTAAIPRVVSEEDLLTANAILPTLGTIAAALGGAIGAVVTFFSPGLPEDLQALAALICAAAVLGLSSVITARIGRDTLGPLHPLDAMQVREHFRDLLRGLREGAAYLRVRVTPFNALLVMSAQRFLYGLMYVSAILIARNVLSAPGSSQGSLGSFTVVLFFAAGGFALAAFVTPAVGRRVGRQAWVVWCLVIGATGQIILAASGARWALFTAAVVVSFSVQGAKIAIDTIVQRDTEDEVRGRTFALYDMAYNVAFMTAGIVGAIVLPNTGYSAPVMAALAVCYLILAFAYSRAPRDARPLPGSGPLHVGAGSPR